MSFSTLPEAASVRSCALSGLDVHLQQKGLDFALLLDECEIHPDGLKNPDSTIGLANLIHFLEVLARASNDDNVGVTFGLQFDPRELGLLGYIFFNSPTLGHALAELSRLLPIHQDNTMVTFHHSPGQCGVEYQVAGIRSGQVRQDSELSVAIMMQFCRSFLGPAWTPEEVHFQHNKPMGWRRKEDLFKAPVYYGQAANGIYFPSKCLANKNPYADPNLLKILQPIADQRLAESLTKVSLLDRVQYQIERNLADENLSIRIVGQGLGVGYRTLQRRLNEEGLNFSELVDQAKRRRAQDLISDPSVSVTESAYMLGYSDSSAFSRAFKRWFGATPRNYRRAQTEYAG